VISFLPQIGALPGWRLEFEDSKKPGSLPTIDSSDYYATIDATLPGGLESGSYTLVVEGMTSSDYAALFNARANLQVTLHLFWRDTLKSPIASSPVAKLRVTSLKRRVGSRRYEVVIEARELAYDRLLQPLAEKGPPIVGAFNAAAKIISLLGGSATKGKNVDAPAPSTEPHADEWSWSAFEPGVKWLLELGRVMEASSEQFGLGMSLIRDGEVYFGPGRLDLTTGAAPAVLTAEHGLLRVESKGQESTDPNWVPKTPFDSAPKRDVYELLARGRPDIKPGDIIQFTRPPDERDAAGVGLSATMGAAMRDKAETVKAYVRGVQHRLAREIGFTTTVHCIAIPEGGSAWFKHSRAQSEAVAPRAKMDGDGGEADLAYYFNRLGDRRIGTEVAEVRGCNPGEDDLPGQTEKISRGLAPPNGQRYGAVRLDFDHQAATAFTAAPYATPFAFGKFGLVVPRYPGMRVLVAHRNNDTGDPVDVGALWRHGEAPASNPGDWWLSLPAAIPANQRRSVADNAAAPAPAGKASNDLIDADGVRVIEVGKLTFRVGTDKLADAGARPQAEAAPVHIEHASGSRITIDQDGNIAIESKGTLKLAAEQDITIESKANVQVKVGGTMDVS
jgi:hypothetical protein